jgi:hypothetical protein
MSISARHRVRNTYAGLFTLALCAFWYACETGPDPAPTSAVVPIDRDHKLPGIAAEEPPPFPLDVRLETPGSDPTFYGWISKNCMTCHYPIYNHDDGDGLTYWDRNGNYLGRRDSSVFHAPYPPNHQRNFGIDYQQD